MCRRPARRTASSAPRRSRSSGRRTRWRRSPPSSGPQIERASSRSRRARRRRRRPRVGVAVVGLGEVDEHVASPSMSASVMPSAGSARPTSSMSAAPSTASQTVCPSARPPPRPRRGSRSRSWAASGSIAVLERVLVGADAGRRQPLGRPQLARERPRSSSVTASIRSTSSSTQSSGISASTSAPSRFIRAPVDSSASTHPALEVLLGRGELLLGRRVLVEALAARSRRPPAPRRGCRRGCRRRGRSGRCPGTALVNE